MGRRGMRVSLSSLNEWFEELRSGRNRIYGKLHKC